MTYDKICLMLPTYKRHETMLPTFIDSAIRQASDVNNIRFCFCVNEKDPGTLEYLKNYNFPCKYAIVLENTEKPNLSKYFNMMYYATKSMGESTVVSMCGDDMAFITKGYDRELLELINAYKGVGVFWANDNYIAKERMCVNMFVTRKFVEATGEPFMCEKYPAEMIDYLWYKVGKYTKSLHYLPNTIIQHNHSTALKPEQRDETFNRLRPAQVDAHVNYGKKYAKELAAKIAERLKAKGYIGDNA